MSNYDVGYGKPPKAHRYEKGQSGNPTGRRKAVTGNSLLQDIQDELKSPVSVLEGGKKKKVTKQQLLIKSLFKKAMEANPHALKQLNQMTNGFEPAFFGGTAVEFRMTSTGIELIKNIEREILEIEEEKLSR